MEITQHPHFKTKTGYCYLLPEGILLSRIRLNGSQEFNTQSNKPVMVLFYSVLLALALFRVGQFLLHPSKGFPYVFSLLGLAAVFTLISLFQYSGVNMLYKENIREIQYKKGIPGLSRAHFIVHFEQSGKIRKRLIPLPGTLGRGRTLAETAQAQLQDAGYNIVS